MVAVTPACVAWLPVESGDIACVAFFGMAVIYGVAAVVGRWEWFWRVADLAHGYHAIAAVAWRITNESGSPDITAEIRTGVTPIIGVVAVVFALGSLGADLFRQRYRVWLHWVGMACCSLKWYGLIRVYVVPYFLPR